MKKCKLCGSPAALHKHHLIPKSVIKELENPSKIATTTVKLCEECHTKIHMSFLNHLVMTKKLDGVNRFDGIKFRILREFLKAKHKNVYNEFRRFFKEFINESLKEYKEGNEDETIST